MRARVLPIAHSRGIAARVHDENLLEVLARSGLGGKVAQRRDLAAVRRHRGRGGEGRGDAVHITVGAALCVTGRHEDNLNNLSDTECYRTYIFEASICFEDNRHKKHHRNCEMKSNA